MFAQIASWWRPSGAGRQSTPPANQTTTPWDEHYVWVRYPAGTQGGHRQASAGEAERFSARVRSVSRGKISLQTTRSSEPGSLLVMELPGPAGRSPDLVLACVVQATAQASEWQLDCAFASELGDEDLQLLGAQRVRADVPDRRAWVRFPSPASASFREVTTGQASRQAAQVLDISASGVGLLVNQPVEVGVLLNIEMQGPAGPVSNILGCVVCVRGRAEGQWVLGCNFIQELNDRELRDWLTAPASV